MIVNLEEHKRMNYYLFYTSKNYAYIWFLGPCLNTLLNHTFLQSERHIYEDRHHVEVAICAIWLKFNKIVAVASLNINFQNLAQILTCVEAQPHSIMPPSPY